MKPVEFLQRFHPDRPWVLTAIEPNQKGIETAAFTPEQTSEAEAWIAKHDGRRNLYFSVAEVLKPEDKKAGIDNVRAVHWLHVDIDAGNGDLLAELTRIRNLVTTDLPAGAQRPTIVVYSGGGYQAFWQLDQPIPIEGNAEAAKEAARYNKQLELLFGGDACHNVDRIMRLPGTMNLPNQRKLQRGRVPVLAEVLKASSAKYALQSFTPAADRGTVDTLATVEISGNVARLNSVDDLSQWGVADRVKVIVVQGRDPETPKEGDDSRSVWLFDCVCQLVRAGVPDDVIYSVITDPGFKVSESVLAVANPDRYAKKQIRSAKEAAESEWLYKLNSQYAVVQNLGGRCMIISEVFDQAMQRHRLAKQSFQDFKNAFCNQTETSTDSKGNIRQAPVGKWWLEHPKRRQYTRLVFEPGHTVPDAYNLWQGYGCNAIPGNKHESYLKHLHKTVCSGVDEHYEYLVGWMARAVQHPGTTGHTAVVMRGRPGTGKSFMAKHFGRLFGRHYMPVSNAAHLTGNFNSHLRDAIVVFGDEAFFAGDSRHEGVLKTLITEEIGIYEMKGVDAEASPNYVHLILASNSDWVVPVGAGDRRFFVLDVSEEFARDAVHFGAIAKDLESGGYENLLYYLLHYDLSDYKVQNIPTTAAHQSQRQESLEPHEEWWMSVLIDGQLGGLPWPMHTELVVPNAALREHYQNYTSFAPPHKVLSPTKLGIYLKRMCPAGFPVHSKTRFDGRIDNSRRFPSLSSCRGVWDRVSGIPQDWPEVDEVVAAPQQYRPLPF